MGDSPLIRSTFVRNHVRALERERGEAGVGELARRFGSLSFLSARYVPVSEESRMLECIVEMTKPGLDEQELAREAGRLHFKNFSESSLYRIITTVFGDDMKLLLLQGGAIAKRVFRGIEVRSENLGERVVRITFFGLDIPLEHFEGFFEAWMKHSGFAGTVSASAPGTGIYEYTLAWNEPHVEVSYG